MNEERISIKIRLKYSDASLFQQRFAPYMSQFGMFLPTKHLKHVGTPLFFEFLLSSGERVFCGEGTVVQIYPRGQYPTSGLGIRFTSLTKNSQSILGLIMQDPKPKSSLVPQLPPAPINVYPSSQPELPSAASNTARPPTPPPISSSMPPAMARPGARPSEASREAGVPPRSAAPQRSSPPPPSAAPNPWAGTRPEPPPPKPTPTSQDSVIPSSSDSQPNVLVWGGDSPSTAGFLSSMPQKPERPPLPLHFGAESELPRSGPIIGIDLGTTNSCCAIVEGVKPRVIPSRYGYNTIPSIVAYDERKNLLIGHPAKSQMMLNPHNTVYGSKRLVGRKYNSPIVQIIKNRFLYEIVETSHGDSGVRIDGHDFTLQEVSALILTEIKEIAQSYLEQPIYRAVISVPAYYNDNQRQAVRKAGAMAGLHVERIVNEPTAAALAYGFGRGLEQKLLVYDLGGGTFDASVLQVHNDVYEVISTGGNTFLGGVDFDNRLIDYVLREFHREHGLDLRQDAVKMQRIKDAVEKVKCDLSHEKATELMIPYIDLKEGVPLDIRMRLDRELLNKLVGDLVEETIRVCDAVLNAQGLLAEDIDEVLLVGGQTRMPLIHERLKEHFGTTPHRGIHPDEAVALGTSILAYSLDQQGGLVQLVDVLAMSIGIGLPGGRFKRIAPRNHKLPFEKKYTISTTRNNQTDLELVIFQGESPNVADNEYLGTMKLTEIAPMPRGQAKFDLCFQLNTECILTVTAKDLQTNKIRKLTLSTLDTPEDLKSKLDIPEATPEQEQAQEVADEAHHGERGLLAWIKRMLKRDS